MSYDRPAGATAPASQVTYWARVLVGDAVTQRTFGSVHDLWAWVDAKLTANPGAYGEGFQSTVSRGARTDERLGTRDHDRPTGPPRSAEAVRALVAEAKAARKGSEPICSTALDKAGVVDWQKRLDVAHRRGDVAFDLAWAQIRAESFDEPVTF